MILYYRAFGAIACIVLTANVVLLVAVMSWLQASLSLPGIAGIVLTVGMAADANVLIYERVREELRAGNSRRLRSVPVSTRHSRRLRIPTSRR